MYPDYTQCMNCAHTLETVAVSPDHARTMAEPTFDLSLAWCFQCGLVTVYQKPFISRLFDFAGLRAKKIVNLDTVEQEFYRFPNGNPHYEELIWLISRCLIERAKVDNSPDATVASWQMAKEKLAPRHLLTYLQVVSSEVSKQQLLDWLDELTSLIQQGNGNPHLAEAVTSLRFKLQPIELSSGQTAMMLSTSGAMLVAHAGGGIKEKQLNLLVEFVAAYQQQDKSAIARMLMKQYAMVAQTDNETLERLFLTGKKLSLEVRRELLILCYAISIMNGKPNEAQLHLIDTFFRWLNVSMDEKDLLWRIAEKREYV